MKLRVVVNGELVEVDAPDTATASEVADLAAAKAGAVFVREHAWLLREEGMPGKISTPLPPDAAYQWRDGTLLVASLDVAWCEVEVPAPADQPGSRDREETHG